MSEIDFEKIGLKVGLEIHQQLDTKKKLFCKCRPIESDEYTEKFSRSLRTAKSELGKLDPAPLFEKTKSKKINYYANSQSSCLVEKDEEPPHDLDHDAKKISLLISSMLESKIFSEIHVMRKTVIDGSNTSGFQRTMLVSQGGNLKVGEKKIGVQAVCLEEDAAKLLSNEQNETNYSLDRLGVPLVEIALEPVSTKPSEVKEIALTLGRLLRATRMVKRGIGTIRQDVNISVMNSGVVEVKGVQQLDQLEKIINYESKRQHGLILIAEKLKKLSITITKEDIIDVTEIFKACESKIIQKALKSNAKIAYLGVMAELGDRSSDAHLEVKEYAEELGVEVVAVATDLYGDSQVVEIEDVLPEIEKKNLGKDDALLFKASRIVGLEKVVEEIIT